MSTHNAINWALNAARTMKELAEDEDYVKQDKHRKPKRPFTQQRTQAADELKLAYFFLTGESI
jgi:hypothetical protein